MPSPIIWSTSPISDGDLVTAPTSLGDPNVIVADNAETLAFSAAIVGGTSPAVTVTLYFYNPTTTTFELVGDSFTLDPTSDNLMVYNPSGLTIGVTATASGSPTSFELHHGTR